MQTTIESVSGASFGEWREIWRDCDYATYFHSPEWAQLWERHTEGRVRPSPKLFRFADGKQALLPLSFESKLGGLLSRYVSSPECTFGGWIAREPLSTGHALELIDWMLKRQGHNLVWRLNPYDPVVFEAGKLCGLECRSDETHALDLSIGQEALFKALKPSYRADIRKALKAAAFRIAPAETLADWQEYYRVYEDSQRRWGVDAANGYSPTLFEALHALKSPYVRLWVARNASGEIVSGDVCFYAKTHVVYWHGSTLQQHLASNVAKLVKYEVIKDACERGYAWYDFNPSAGLSGVKFFKEAFRARALPAPVVYVDTALKRLARVCAATLKVQHAMPVLAPLEHVASTRAAAPASGLAQ
jgi:hypothetical protein